MQTETFPNNCGTDLARSVRGLVRSAMKPALVSVAAALTLATTASARQADYTVVGIEVNQTIQLGTTPLIGNRSTMVRTQIAATGTPAKVDGLLRIFDGGVETANSPVFSDNGPFNVPAVQAQGSLANTLNFTFIPPTSSNVVITVEVNPSGPNFAAETNTANNIGTTGILDFRALKVAELTYVNVDLDPTGGSNPNPAPTALIQPGNGDNFLQGIFPSSDWFYHRSDFPTKLWTASVASSSGGSALVSSLAVDRQMMVPIPDYIYGWVPGGISYNGVSTIGGPASMGNSQNFKNQRTFAHEIGHNFGRSHVSTKLQTHGIDVEGHLNETENLQKLKGPTLNDIMVPGLNTDQAWVASTNYNFFINHSTFSLAESDAPTVSDEPSLMIAGLWNKATGEIQVTDNVTFRGGELTDPVDELSAQLVVKTYRDGKLSQVLPISARSSADECKGCQDPATDGVGDVEHLIPFMAVLPANLEGYGPIQRVLVTDPSKKSAAPHDARRSQSAPKVAFLPTIGETVGDTVRIAWEGSDADGDELTYYLRYCPDGEERMVPLATPTKATEFTADLRQLPGYADGKGFFELMATDGLNTTRAQSAPLRSASDAIVGSDPWVEIMTPDTNVRYKQGATVILHSSGWDLEDRHITGSSLQWFSSSDGSIGSGRRASVNTLSPGGHIISVVATDSDGMTSSDAAFIFITGRSLPDTQNCYTDLGFGGPGTGFIQACGGDLSTGTTFDFSLTGLPSNAKAWLMASNTMNPVPAFNGTIVPNPVTTFLKIPIDVNGELFATGLDGGGGPITFFFQVYYLDAAQTLGVGLTNAIQMDYLP